MLVAVKILRNVVLGVSRSRFNDRIEALTPGWAIALHGCRWLPGTHGAGHCHHCHGDIPSSL